MSADLLGMLLGLDNQSVDDTVREGYVRAPFGYPGSKAKSIKNILPHLPYTDMYCEPFGGSGAVWLARNESRLEVFNDRYSGVTAFYRALKDKVTMDALVERLEFMVHSREEFTWCRSTWKDCQDIVDRAARWFYTVHNSFGSQCLYFGRSRNPANNFTAKFHNSLKTFYSVHERIKHAQIENLDWRLIFHDYNRPECVWYLDPPYYKSTKGMYECELADDEHVELLERVQHLDGFVAMSGYPNELYERYPWDKIVVWEQSTTTMGMAFTGSNKCLEFKDYLKRENAMEVLYIRYNRSK